MIIKALQLRDRFVVQFKTVDGWEDSIWSERFTWGWLVVAGKPQMFSMGGGRDGWRVFDRETGDIKHEWRPRLLPWFLRWL